ncbi:hypothetical protein HNV11_16460 [Spirosoma taeanense]|uniref:Uncharacterized protein n=1 Tax=Spirosoma taeanense TaxID=2735870 RepID=A0A6M5YC24_9BACT|nr:hypothetical protein [Spirosoma taeanense]QJW90856.1 hypothetical protein HNV11_16460 [Spirosoma taeanense]
MNNPAVGGGDYIEFKLDGKPYQYVEKIGVTSTALAMTSTPALPLYQISMVAHSAPASQTVNLQLISKTPFKVGKYSYSVSDVTNRPFFLFTYAQNSAYETPVTGIAGEAELTKVESAKGGTVEGTFTLKNIEEYKTATGVRQLLSKDHTLTEGKFRFTVK